MRPWAAIFLIGAVSMSVACGSGVPTNLSTATSPSVAVAFAPLDSSTIGFSGLTGDGSAVTSYSESSFRVSMPAGDWRVRTTYGNPAPFVQFWADAGKTANGEIVIAAPGATYFKSVDLYSSTTPVPYVIKGLRNSAVVFTMTGTVSNSYGTFRTVSNPNALLIDTLSIALTNTAAACCRNPMGLDDIAFTDRPLAPPATYSVTGTVTDGATGAALSGAKVTVKSGPDYGKSTTTNAAGAFTLADLAEGGLSINVTATNYLSSSQGILLSANQTLVFKLTRDPSTIPFPTPPAGATIIGFGGLASNGAGVASYTESGFNVAATAAAWVASTAVGHPAPHIQFFAESTTVIGRVDVTAGGAAFTFVSVELYSSTTRIPYTMTGFRNGESVFVLAGEIPNTAGNFRSVVNPNTTSPVDKVTIVLTNVAVGRNPMGLDTIVVVK